MNRLLALALERGAIKYGDFTLTSGKKSSFYFDGRLLSLDPERAHLISQAILPLLEQAGAKAVGGTTLGADPMVAAVALASHLNGGSIPAFIVRKESKAHGTKQNIEGPLISGINVAIVDDVCTTGGSLFHAIEAAEEVGCTVVKVVSVLDAILNRYHSMRESQRCAVVKVPRAMATSCHVPMARSPLPAIE